MAFLRVTSPHAHVVQDTTSVMRLVLLATIPGVAALTWFFGFGTLVNIAWACVVALVCEAAVLKLRRRPIALHLKDYSALVTATLLAIALPPYAPWWVVFIGTAVAIVIAKQLYGGLGYNPFNPAMVAYVVLLISLPVQMTSWAAPLHVTPDQPLPPGLIDALRINFGWASDGLDAFTMATPLDIMRQNDALMIDDLWAANPQFGRIGGFGWEWVNAGFLLGGALLLARKVFTWHAPVAFLAAIILLSGLGYDSGSSHSAGSPLFHLFTGATMFGAFFILTDPVTSAVSNRGRLVYGALAGALVYIIRAWGNYPDAVAFAVLLVNFAAPFIDYYTQPRTYGHR
jgi:electron transport complex protein RnfD